MQSVKLNFLNVNSQLWFEVVKCDHNASLIGQQYGISSVYTVYDSEGYPVDKVWYAINWQLHRELECRYDEHKESNLTQAALIQDECLIGFVYTTASNGTKVSYGGVKLDNGSIVEVGRAKISRATKYLAQSGQWLDAPVLYINQPNNGSFEGVQ